MERTEDIEKKIKEKELHNWEQIKCEFDLKGSEKDWKKKQKIMQFRGILRIIENQWKLTSQSKVKKQSIFQLPDWNFFCPCLYFLDFIV